MGVKKFKRPILARGGLQVDGGSTFTAPVIFSGSAGPKYAVESLTGSSVAQTVSAYGVSFLTYGSSGKTNDFILPVPPGAGYQKQIFVVNNTTSVELNINTNATANTFWGTTFNTAVLAVAATGSPGGTPGGTVALFLVGASTSQWAVVSGTTFSWDLSASTGSTATA